MTAGSVLCGFYGRNNLGDEAILAGMLDLLAQARPDDRQMVLTADPRGTRRDHGVDAALYRAEHHAVKDPRRRISLVRSLLGRDGFLLGGGDLLRDSPTQEVVGGWLMPLVRAQALRRRTGVLGISVGDLFRPESRTAVRAALGRTSFVVVRDVASRDRLLELDVQTEVVVGPDLALRVFRAEDRRPDLRASRSRVLVSVRGLADRADAVTSADHQRGLMALSGALDDLAETGAEIVLVPLRSRAGSLQPVDDDYVASLELAHLARSGHRFEVLRHVPTVAALRELTATADLVIGMRLHSIITAVGLGVPCIALSYDSKVDGFCDEVGMTEDCRAVEDLDREWLAERAGAHLRGAVSAPTGLGDYRARDAGVVDVLRGW